MTIPEAVHLVLQAGGLGHGGELFVLNMGSPLKVVDLARDLIKLSGFSLDEMPIVFTGMRPGEKLVEELWEEGATVDVTAHRDVLKVSESELWSDTQLEKVVGQLCAESAAGNRQGIAAIITEALTTFTPDSLSEGARQATDIF
jgi:FlaA1/EpsC-like NDP-sugar epimerase